nr:hypothetical protein [Tanacetum cinerariifolium]
MIELVGITILGVHMWPTLYKHLRDANVKRWQHLYASDPTNETDTKSYSIEATDDYYMCYRRHPRIVAWSFKHKFYRHMLKPMLHGQLPVERLVPDETKARSRWWVSSRAYFDGRSFEDEQIPRHLNRNNYFEVPSEMYREFEEQRRGYQQMKEKNADMYEKMTRFMDDMRRVPEANTTPIIADQYFGGQLPIERLVTDETEARSDGFQVGPTLTGVVLKMNIYLMKEKNDDMYEKMTRFMDDMRRVPEANTTPIIADQHFGVSDISGFQSYQ